MITMLTACSQFGRLSCWRDLGIVQYRSVMTHTGSEKMYGKFFNSGDTVGVLLDMDRSTIAFYKIGCEFGEGVIASMGVGDRYFRRSQVNVLERMRLLRK